jgi:hypothetical protein
VADYAGGTTYFFSIDRAGVRSTDPEFSREAADVVGLYLNPPQNALVLSASLRFCDSDATLGTDPVHSAHVTATPAETEKPCIQALERPQGWIRLATGRGLTDFAHEYKPTTPLVFAALELATGLAHSGHYRRCRRREFLDFINELVSNIPAKSWTHLNVRFSFHTDP